MMKGTVELEVFENKERAQRVYQKVGFKEVVEEASLNIGMEFMRTRLFWIFSG